MAKRTAKPAAKAGVTILDIAREAGVSPSTVSRALGGNQRVDPALRAAVEEAARRLRYRPNAVAQGLVRGRSQTIGVLTQNMNSLFYAEMVMGIERRVAGSGYFPLFASGNWNLPDLPNERDAFNVLLGRQIDALIVLGGQLPDAEISAAAAAIPVVVVGRMVAGLEARCLVTDNKQGAYAAARYLIQAGHRRIAHITGNLGQPDAAARLAGYRRALADAAIPFDERLVVEGTFEEHSGVLAIETLLTRGAAFSAVFAANDPMAYGARLALFRHGIRVPEEVSLVGFDDLPISLYAIPPLTSVRQPAFAMGDRAAAAVLDLLAGRPAELALLPTELIIRESTRSLR